MPYVVYSKKHGPVAYYEAPIYTAQLREGEVAIPCERGADVNDSERWAREAQAMEGKYAPTLEAAQQRKREELMLIRDGFIAAGFKFGEYVFPLAQDVQMLMTQEFIGSQNPLMQAPSYAWKDVSGEYRTIGNAEAFQAFCVQAMGYGKTLFAREAMLQEVIKTCPTIEEVAAIAWDMEVPEL